MNKTNILLKTLSIDFKKDKPEIVSVFKKLKKKKPNNLDEVVHELHKSVFEEIDCLECGNCCKTLGPRITDLDIAKLSKYLKIKPSDFVMKYLNLDEDNDYVFKKMPCPFILPDNYCSVYDYRPKACKEYPHTDRKKFFQLLDITEKNMETCPAVLQICKGIVKEFN